MPNESKIIQINQNLCWVQYDFKIYIAPVRLQRGGGAMVFFSFRKKISDNTRVRIFIFFVAGFNIRLYDKNSESDYFFFPQPKSVYFLSNIGNQKFF